MVADYARHFSGSNQVARVAEGLRRIASRGQPERFLGLPVLAAEPLTVLRLRVAIELPSRAVACCVVDERILVGLRAGRIRARVVRGSRVAGSAGQRNSGQPLVCAASRARPRHPRSTGWDERAVSPVWTEPRAPRNVDWKDGSLNKNESFRTASQGESD